MTGEHYAFDFEEQFFGIQDADEAAGFRYVHPQSGQMYEGAFEISSSGPVQLHDMTWATAYECYGRLRSGERVSFRLAARKNRFTVAEFTVTKHQPRRAEEKQT